MEQTKNNLLKKAKWLYEKGMVHILGSGILSKVFTFIGNVIVVRVLTKAQYGVFGYVDNIMGFVQIVNALGISYGILQFCSETKDEGVKKGYYDFGLRFGLIFDVVLCGGLVLYALFAPLKIESARTALVIYSLYPIPAFLFQYFCIVLRYKRDNKKFAFLTNLQAGIYAVIEVAAAFWLKEVSMILALYVSSIICSALGLYYVNKNDRNLAKQTGALVAKPLTGKQKSELLRYSGITCANTMISNLLILLDVFLIGVYISNPDVIASYKVASTIPLALIFVPNSIIMFAYPYFAEHNTDRTWFITNTKRLIVASGALNLVITLGLFIFAPKIIVFLWGSKYLSATTAFRILSINYFISATFRINAINIMCAIKKVKENLYINIVSGISNVILDMVLIQRYGANGAAFATLCVVLITTGMLVPVMYRCLNNIGKEALPQ